METVKTEDDNIFWFPKVFFTFLSWKMFYKNLKI
jgi:hypothetical protein